jgi:hypothetical protein
MHNSQVNEYVETLETRYADINSDEGLDEDGNLLEGFSNSCVGGNYPGVESCSPNSNVWQERSYDYDAQFTNWSVRKCVLVQIVVLLSLPRAGVYGVSLAVSLLEFFC